MFFKPFRYNSNISYLSSIVGKPTSIYQSNLPGLINAGSNNSFLLVAAKTTILLLVSNPSISTNNWFSVESSSP